MFDTALESIGLLETKGFSPALLALDAMEKTTGIRLLQAELNDFLGVVLKLAGPTAAVKEAIEVGRHIAETMRGQPVATVLLRPDAEAWKGIDSRVEYNPLIQQNVVKTPAWNEVTTANTTSGKTSDEERAVNQPQSFALGLIETQGFTAVFEAIDTACKTANVEVVGKEKLGGGYVTIIIKGDVAAVNAAVQAGSAKVDGLGKLIAAHVIARPSASVLSLLPKS
jgi:carbon dioxide concentrating mechanism protein CcmO